MRRTRNYFSRMQLITTILALVMALAVQIGYTPQVRAQVITDVIELGDEGGGVAVNSDSNRVYVAVGRNINVYDTLTHALITTITLPQNVIPCQDVAVNTLTNRIYAAGYNRTYVIDGNTNTVLANLDKPGNEIAVNTTTDRIYIASRQFSPYTDPIFVHVLNGVDNTWLPDIPLGTPNTLKQVHLATNSITNQVYITYSGDNDLRVLDGNTDSEITRVHVNYIQYVAVNPDTNRVFVANINGDVIVLDGEDLLELSTISKFGEMLRVNPSTNRLYGVMSAENGYVTRIADLNTNRIVGYIFHEINWQDLDIHLTQGSLFATSPWGKEMSVIQDASPTSPAPEPLPPAVIATFDLPYQSGGIAVNSVTNRLYVGVGGGISVYNATSLDSLANIPLSNDPTSPYINDIGVDEARNRVFALTASGAYVINGANNQVIGTLGNDSKSNGDKIAINPANGRVYISDTGYYLGEPDLVKIYDGVSLSYIRTLNLGTSSHFQGVSLAVNPTTGYAYCTYTLDNGLHIISPVTDDVVQTISYTSIGAVVMNPVTNRIYVRVSRSGQLGMLILDGNTYAELGMLKGISGSLINPQTDRLYTYLGYTTTLFRAYDGELGTKLSQVFLDGMTYDYAIHPGLSRLYVTYKGPSDIYTNKMSVIQDADTLMVLTVNKTGTGSGTVSSSPGGIDCGATCSFAFPNNASVILTAVPNAISSFTGWSGAGCSGTGTCSVTMNTAKYVTANFTHIGGYLISGNVGAGGVTLRYTDGQPQTTRSDSSGDYSITVTSGWSGTVTPIDLCYIFSPPNRSYTNVTADMTGQDYTATAITCYMNYLPLTMK